MNLHTNKTFAKLSDKYYQAKPTIFVVVGMVGTVAAAYLAWRAGRKSEAVIEEIKDDISEVRAQRYTTYTDAETGETSVTVKEGAIDSKQYALNLAKVYIKASYKLGKVVAPAVLTEAAALAAIGTGYGVLNERHFAVVALANRQAKFIDSYRKRVAGKIGDDKEKELYYGYHEEEFEEPDLDENGEPKLNKKGEPRMIKSKRMVLEEALSEHSMYAQIFDPEYTPECEVDSETGDSNDFYNMKIVKDRCKYLNMTIKNAKYHMYTLNELYDMFKLKRKAFGQAVGYHVSFDDNGEMYFDNGDPEGIRAELYPVWYHDDVTGALKHSYIIDFNVPGSILEFYDKENNYA